MIDVIVAGAGPAGSVAALVLARAGARVCLLERDAMPRPKLCGDVLSPGAVAALGSIGIEGGPLGGATRLRGMLVTSPRAQVRALYRAGHAALALSRSALDHWLAEAAVAAGARLECGVRVCGPIWREEAGRITVAGVQMRRAGKSVRVPALVTIGADGRHSALAREAGLSRTPAYPQRWAMGLYATDICDMSDMGEVHLLPGHYVGLAPLGGGLTNICVTGPNPSGIAPEDAIRRVLAGDATLRERTAEMRMIGEPRESGPLAMDCAAPGIPGLLLAGDAAGFVDPMVGDGTHLAIRGGVRVAAAALEALETGNFDASVARLGSARSAAGDAA